MTVPHIHIEGHIYYVTTNVYKGLRIFTRPAYVLPLLDSLNFYRYKHAFRLLGYAIMPNHVHFILWPHGEPGLEEIMRDYKKFTAVRIIRQAEVEGNAEWLAAFRQAGDETGRSEHKVWQDSFWDKNVYTQRFLRQKLNYLHRNPVRSKLVPSPGDYPYSSYRNYEYGDESLIEVDRGWL
jgi:REP element-mobilizing transposase RayT